MKKIAFIFPGQGSQYVGMGQELYSKYERVREIFNSANKVLGYDLTKIMFDGPLETLSQTQYTQPAIFTLSVATYILLQGEGVTAQAVAGHSLGEYSALAASGILSFEDGLKIVQIRGRLLQEASAKNPGTMAAIVGLDNEKVEAICKSVKAGVVEAVNYNCPGQLVIAGQTAAVQEAMKEAQNAGAMKVIQLQVSGPFHSSLMKDTSFQLEKELANFALHEPLVPIVANCSARFIQNISEARFSMIKQVYSPVLWEKSVGQLINNGSELFVEAGPGKVLGGLLKRINRKMPCANVENESSLQGLLSKK